MESYILELKNNVIDKYENNIKTKNDARILSNKIFEATREYVSESTIRRFFYLMPPSNPSITTLNIFSRYIGFDNFYQFTEYHNSGILNVISLSGSDEFIIDEFSRKSQLSFLDIHLLTNHLILLLKEGSLSRVKTYFNSLKIKTKLSKNKNINDLFAQLLGPYIENPIIVDNPVVLLDSMYFKELVLYHYVDVYNINLERYYHALLKMNPNKLDFIFVCSVISLNHFYRGDLNTAAIYFKDIDSVLPENYYELKGRIELLNWIFFKDEKRLINEGKKNQKKIRNFSLDIVLHFIYHKEIEMLKIWFSNFPDLFKKENDWFDKEIDAIIKIGEYMIKEDQAGLLNYVNNKIKILNSQTVLKCIINNILNNDITLVHKN
jgi:hypothetical protein